MLVLFLYFRKKVYTPDGRTTTQCVMTTTHSMLQDRKIKGKGGGTKEQAPHEARRDTARLLLERNG